jgi:hypothetical protein
MLKTNGRVNYYMVQADIPAWKSTPEPDFPEISQEMANAYFEQEMAIAMKERARIAELEPYQVELDGSGIELPLGPNAKRAVEIKARDSGEGTAEGKASENQMSMLKPGQLDG